MHVWDERQTTDSVVDTIQQYQADHRHVGNYGYLNIEHVCADAGTQFMSLEFKQYCWAAGIQLVLAAPKKQYQNHLTKRIWQTICQNPRYIHVSCVCPYMQNI